MLTSKIAIPGTPKRFEPGRIVMVDGDAVDTYSESFYRFMPELAQPQEDKKRVAPKSDA